MRIKQNAKDWRIIYEAFLASSAWSLKRARVLRRSPVCESCLLLHATQVHHTVYPQPVTLDTLTQQPNWQLRAVCTDCHERIHAA